MSHSDDLKLVRGAENYNFLNKSGCVEVDTRDDIGDFRAVTVCCGFLPVTILHTFIFN